MGRWSDGFGDGDSPAEIRVTGTRDGDAWKAVKGVRPVGADDTKWALRNQTALTRVDDGAAH